MFLHSKIWCVVSNPEFKIHYTIMKQEGSTFHPSHRLELQAICLQRVLDNQKCPTFSFAHQAGALHLHDDLAEHHPIFCKQLALDSGSQNSLMLLTRQFGDCIHQRDTTCNLEGTVAPAMQKDKHSCHRLPACDKMDKLWRCIPGLSAMLDKRVALQAQIVDHGVDIANHSPCWQHETIASIRYLILLIRQESNRRKVVACVYRN